VRRTTTEVSDGCPRLAPYLLVVGVERAFMIYEMFDFGAPRAPRTVPTGLSVAHNQALTTHDQV
jgi:hypothetical protein